jgi:hypothetical protein
MYASILTVTQKPFNNHYTEHLESRY